MDFDVIILHAVQIEASFASPFPRSKRKHFHCGSLQVSLNFLMASNQTARGILTQFGPKMFDNPIARKALI